MRLLKTGLLLSALLCFAIAGLTSAEEDKTKSGDAKPKATQKKEIQWYAYDEGLVLAKETDRHVFIDFTAKWCGYCKKMEREAFADSTVIALLNNDFVPVKVDGDSKNELNIDGYKTTEQDLTRFEYKVRGYPSFWFLKPDGTKLTNVHGYRQTDFMVKALTFIKDYKYDSTRTEGTTQGR